jgi:two-component system, chemotaxis family, protein-glutamate methylesterase/glutaminase
MHVTAIRAVHHRPGVGMEEPATRSADRRGAEAASGESRYPARARIAIAIGGSAGAIPALLQIVPGLDPTLRAAILVVVHLPPSSRSLLPGLLTRAGRLLATRAQDGEPLRESRIYVAPPDLHMRVQDGIVRLDRGARENRSRPAIDPLFRSIAAGFGRQGIGVVLSGTLDDGSAGLAAIERAGGTVIVQDPADASYADMPAAARRSVSGVLALRAQQIAGRLLDLVDTLQDAPADPADRDAPQGDRGPSSFSCPDCGGVLHVEEQGTVTRFVCRVGHAYSLENFAAAQDQRVEDALWFALRVIEERIEGGRRLAERFSARGDAQIAARYLRRTDQAERQAAVIRQALGITESRATRAV